MEELRELVEQGMTLQELAQRLGASRDDIRGRLRAAGLETQHMTRRRELAAARRDGRDSVTAWCRRHGVTDFAVRGDSNTLRCLRCRSEDVSRARRRRKQRLVEEAGGRCQTCGYGRYAGALQFHHLDPSEKSFSLSERGIPRALTRARAEVAKCVLLCANCHAEVEAGLRMLS